MGLLLFWNGVEQIATTEVSRRRYVDDPFYSVAIGHRLPMNIASGAIATLQTAGARTGDLCLLNDGGTYKLCLWNGTSWLSTSFS